MSPSLNSLRNSDVAHRLWPARDNTLLWQIVVVLLVWLYLVCLHVGNDGLWFQGDAPRHAANGAFWKDFLARFPVNPLEFALSYYASYPVLSVSAYPPAFYLLEAVAFTLFGVSPFVAKDLVLIFTLLAGCYLIAWLRRWVSEESGWLAGLLMLQPGVIVWSHAVMLNIPSMALSLAALYHARRWMESPDSRHVYAAIIFTGAGIMTYVHTGVVIVVVLTWMILTRRWTILWDRRFVRLALVAAMLIGAWVIVAIRWAPTHAGLLLPDVGNLFTIEQWAYYVGHFSKILSIPVIVSLALGVLASIVTPAWRRESMLLVAWLVVYYSALSIIMAKELRYALPLIPPAIILAVIGWSAMLRWCSALMGATPSRLSKVMFAGVLAAHVWVAPSVLVPDVEGFRPLVALLDRVAPRSRVFYDGHYNGIFSFYMRVGDPDFQRSVVVGNKLLYTSTIATDGHLTERASSQADVVNKLQRECGCSWVALERTLDSQRQQIKALTYLRAAVRGSEFEWVTSFPIHVVERFPGRSLEDDIQVDVYRLLRPVEHPDTVEYHFPFLGEGTVFQVKPIR